MVGLVVRFRGYDPRLGRWKSLDPLHSEFPWQSAYVAFDNNPILLTDARGDSTEKSTGGKSKGQNYHRAEGANPPYIYSIKIGDNGRGSSMNPNYAHMTITDNEVNGDDVAHFNSYKYGNSFMPNRFISHYIHGDGGDYDLTPEEYRELNPTFPDLSSSKQLQNAPWGVSNGTFKVEGISPNVDGTVGTAMYIFEGKLQKMNDFSFRFEGVAYLYDVYDFNWWSSERSPTNRFLTFWGAISMPWGTSFKVYGPKFEVVQTGQGSTLPQFPRDQFKGSDGNRGKARN